MDKNLSLNQIKRDKRKQDFIFTDDVLASILGILLVNGCVQETLDDDGDGKFNGRDDYDNYNDNGAEDNGNGNVDNDFVGNSFNLNSTIWIGKRLAFNENENPKLEENKGFISDNVWITQSISGG